VISIDDYNIVELYTDLDIHFKSEWVEKFISAEITVVKNGKPHILTTHDHCITEDLRSAMLDGDPGEVIRVSYRYLPKNTLKDNIVREDGFSFTLLPDNDATFPGGEEKLDQYLSEIISDQVSADDLDMYNLAAVKFTVSHSGDIINSRVVSSSNYNYIDTLLLNVISDMPAWTPARYSDGTQVSQDFVFTVGDHGSCVISTLDLARYSFK
jgi:hypothetical protein